jgi:hypothetical protein
MEKKVSAAMPHEAAVALLAGSGGLLRTSE